MQNDSKAGTVVVLPTTKANKSVKEVTVMETPEFTQTIRPGLRPVPFGNFFLVLNRSHFLFKKVRI